MARITEIFLVETPQREAVVIRAACGVADIPPTIGTGFGKLEALIGAAGIAPANTPFLRITGSEPEALEVMMGIEVPVPLQGKGEIEAAAIPPGKKLMCYWLGDNSDMSGLYEDMAQYAAQRGHRLREGFWEYYLNGPEVGIENLLTKVVVQLE